MDNWGRDPTPNEPFHTSSITPTLKDCKSQQGFYSFESRLSGSSWMCLLRQSYIHHHQSRLLSATQKKISLILLSFFKINSYLFTQRQEAFYLRSPFQILPIEEARLPPLLNSVKHFGYLLADCISVWVTCIPWDLLQAAAPPNISCCSPFEWGWGRGRRRRSTDLRCRKWWDVISSVALNHSTPESQMHAQTPGSDSICSVWMCNFGFSLSLASISFCFVS